MELHGIRERISRRFTISSHSGAASRWDEQQATVTSYDRILNEINAASNPLRTGLDVLFRQRGMNLTDIEKRETPFSVEMDFRSGFGDVEETPAEIQKILEQVYQGRKVMPGSITISHDPTNSSQTTEGLGIDIKVIPAPGSGSKAENKRGWILLEGQETVLDGNLRIRKRDSNWQWSTKSAPLGIWISESIPDRALRTETGPVKLSTIREIAKLLPVVPSSVVDAVSVDKVIKI